MYRLVTLLASALAAAPATATTLTATNATIAAVFAGAAAGDTIRLSGSFGSVTLQNRSFASRVTIDARAATITDTFTLSGISNVRLLGGHFGNADAATRGTAAVRITGGDLITISSPVVVGIASAHGIDVVGTSHVTVSGGTFTGLRLGIGFTAVSYGTMSNNRSLHASSDGFNVADSHNVLVSRNSCSGTQISDGAHPDCVQLWSIAGHIPQSDIEISDNTATGATQGFTSFNGDAGGGDRLKFLRNRVDTSYPQGIACYNCRDSIISYNILTTLPGSQFRTSINVVGGSNNIVSNNSVGDKSLDAAADAFDARLGAVDRVRFVDADRALAAAHQASASLAAAGAIPEPASWATLLLGFAGIGAAARRRRRVSA